MDTPATAIIMAPRASTGGAIDPFLQGASHLVQRCSEAGMPVVLVAPAPLLQGWSPAPVSQPLHVAPLPPCPTEQLAAATIRTGVQMSAKSSGWMFIPADMVMLELRTLQSLCTELNDHLIVHATHNNLPRLPMGFGQELFSELIRLEYTRDLLRLMNRYPTHAIEVDDPGVRMHPWLDTHDDRMLSSIAGRSAVQRQRAGKPT